MKRLAITVFLCGIVSIAGAQGYVGAVRALTHFSESCEVGLSCSNKGQGLKFYGGYALPSKDAIDFGFGKVDAIEVGYSRFGRATASGVGIVSQYDQAIVDVNVPVAASMQADALTVAMVAHIPVVAQLAIAVRGGVAYVSSTLRTELDGKHLNSVTESRLKPYVGLGVEYDIPSVVKVTGGVDMTKYDVNGDKGNVRMIGLGVERAF